MNRLSPQNPQMLHPNPPMISIVLPTYNGSKYIRKSIQSVVDQTFTDWELIVVDDCSSDDTPAIVSSFNDKRIVYTRNAVNCRLPRSLNRGFVLATGKYLTWTSDDNYYRADALEKMYNALESNPGTDIVCADILNVDDNEEVISEVHLCAPVYIIEKNTIGACFLFKRDVYLNVGSYDPELPLVEDYDYWLRISKRFKVRVIRDFLYYYRLHDSSLTGQFGAGDISVMASKHGRKSATKKQTVRLFMYRLIYHFAHISKDDRFDWMPEFVVNLFKRLYSYYMKKTYA